MTEFICAIDQGTTGTTAIIVDDEMRIRARITQDFEQIFPQPSWVEHDPEAIWKSTLVAIKGACRQAQITDEDISVIGITNQRETTVVWERDTGAPIYNAVVWQDRRTRDTIQSLADGGHEAWVQQRTGLLLDPYFSATKVKWILDHVDGARTRAGRGELAFGTIDSFLLWRLTDGKVHKTDASNASRTLLMNLDTLEWDPELLELFDVPRELLAEIVGNSELYGVTQGVDGLRDGIPICGMAGDQHAALFGQCCFKPGEAKCTLGTGAFLLMNTGSQRVHSEHRMLATLGWQINGEVTYALEGSAFIAGAMIQWLRDGLGIIDCAGNVEKLAMQVEDSGEIVVIPALAGLGAPHWKPGARGLIWGLTRGTTSAHIARAALEGIAMQNVDVLQAMEKDGTEKLVDLKVDGGAASNNLLMQMQADFLGRNIVRPAVTETTSLGAALLAGLSHGTFKSLEQIRNNWRVERVFEPAIEASEREKFMERWKQGLQRT
ncbi:glycerol kinase GlpK [Bradymonas sediminis]|uniref:glycerol kinase GlpK n=1 Tax=Bradymonas sediminis TaxID=1548548 RepID=UPI00105FA18E|nr:glycerol kinase GlpK [Bradymonas sediminis]TDP76474.1 glycerol kinase [Bradymonas sediminis]